jgi:hypothetical protein
MKRDIEQEVYENAKRNYRPEEHGTAYVIAYACLRAALEYNCKTIGDAQAARRGAERFMEELHRGTEWDKPPKEVAA